MAPILGLPSSVRKDEIEGWQDMMNGGFWLPLLPSSLLSSPHQASDNRLTEITKSSNVESAFTSVSQNVRFNVENHAVPIKWSSNYVAVFFVNTEGVSLVCHQEFWMRLGMCDIFVKFFYVMQCRPTDHTKKSWLLIETETFAYYQRPNFWWFTIFLITLYRYWR